MTQNSRRLGSGTRGIGGQTLPDAESRVPNFATRPRPPVHHRTRDNGDDDNPSDSASQPQPHPLHRAPSLPPNNPSPTPLPHQPPRLANNPPPPPPLNLHHHLLIGQPRHRSRAPRTRFRRAERQHGRPRSQFYAPSALERELGTLQRELCRVSVRTEYECFLCGFSRGMKGLCTTMRLFVQESLEGISVQRRYLIDP